MLWRCLSVFCFLCCLIRKHYVSEFVVVILTCVDFIPPQAIRYTFMHGECMANMGSLTTLGNDYLLPTVINHHMLAMHLRSHEAFGPIIPSGVHLAAARQPLRKYQYGDHAALAA